MNRGLTFAATLVAIPVLGFSVRNLRQEVSKPTQPEVTLYSQQRAVIPAENIKQTVFTITILREIDDSANPSIGRPDRPSQNNSSLEYRYPSITF